MEYFGEFYLDKEKDIVVRLDHQEDEFFYTIYTENYKRDNVIYNLAKIANHPYEIMNDRKVMHGKIPCYIKGDGRKVYILRLNGTKIANVYPNGEIEVNSLIPAISKTLMSQTKDYKYSFRETLIKSYVKEDVKLHTDLHTHANANLNSDCLIALAIKHQIRYPLYYIHKLKLKLSEKQKEYLEQERIRVAQIIDVTGLSKRHAKRKIEDNTFINFADLILDNLENAKENINKIRTSLMILKDSQAVFTNLEKLYLYRYVFAKGVTSSDLHALPNIKGLQGTDVYSYLEKMLLDNEKEEYKNNTLYEDKLLWTAREYKKRHIYYVEMSDTTLVKKDPSNARMLSQVHRIMPYIKAETGVDIRFLAAIRRIPLTLVKDSIVSSNYLTEAIQTLIKVAKDPYVVGSDFVGEEINDIAELKEVLEMIVRKIASQDKDWTIRIHAGENDSLKSNMSKAIELIENALLPNQTFPYVRFGHGLYCESLKSQKGKTLLAKIKKHGIVLEFQFTSNVRLNNIIDLYKHPLKTYLKQGIHCVMGTDGYGIYGTDSIDEQLALENLVKISDDEFKQMKNSEDVIVKRQKENFTRKMKALNEIIGNQNIYEYYETLLKENNEEIEAIDFNIQKVPSYPVLKDKVSDLPWNKYPIVIAGGSYTTSTYTKVSEQDKLLLQALLDELDPNKVFFVVGHKLSGQEKYIVEHNRGFEIYSVVPSLLEEKQLHKLLKANLGIRISTEAQEMGIYKSFNYEIFERRNSVLVAFDGNSSIANLVQEARNGKGKCYIYIYPKSIMLKAKAASLEGYVTIDASHSEVIEKIQQLEEYIGEKKEMK